MHLYLLHHRPLRVKLLKAPNLKLSSLNSFSRSCAARKQAIISAGLVISVEVVPHDVEALERCVAFHTLRLAFHRPLS